MGFFRVLGNLMSGKPAFEAKTSQPLPATSPAGASRANNVVPRVIIDRADARVSGNRLDVDLFIQNESEVVVEISRVEILGTSLSLGMFLNPGEQREQRVYSGPPPRNQYSNKCLVFYKKQTDGDYFCAQHSIRFQKQPDGTYEIDDIIFETVRDV